MKVTISHYEFLKQFPDENAARLYLEDRRWKGSPVCPHCAETARVQVRKVVGYFRCLACKQDFTVRTGTIFERSHIPLDKWLYAMYLISTARKGISSMQISKELGITQKSAWFMLQRIREACGNDPTGGMLSGAVEADEVYLGGKEKNRHESKKHRAGSGWITKTAVLGMRERGGDVRGKVLPDTHVATIRAHVLANVKVATTLYTDEAPAYNMPQYRHRTVNHSAKQYVDGLASTNGIESVWAVLKRGYYGIYHHFTVKHMQRYVDEFTFRLSSQGNCKVHTMARIGALSDKTVGKRLTYRELIGAV